MPKHGPADSQRITRVANVCLPWPVRWSIMSTSCAARTLDGTSHGCPQAPDPAPLHGALPPWPHRSPDAAGAEGSRMTTHVTTGGTSMCRSACLGLLLGLVVTLWGAQATAQRP